MDFKVEGPWNTEKYCRPSWLAGKRILDTLERLKQYHFNFGGNLLTVSALKLYLFFLWFHFLFLQRKKGGGRHGPHAPSPVSPALCSPHWNSQVVINRFV